jgi:hypothetical protein
LTKPDDGTPLTSQNITDPTIAVHESDGKPHPTSATGPTAKDSPTDDPRPRKRRGRHLRVLTRARGPDLPGVPRPTWFSATGDPSGTSRPASLGPMVRWSALLATGPPVPTPNDHDRDCRRDQNRRKANRISNAHSRGESCFSGLTWNRSRPAGNGALGRAGGGTQRVQRYPGVRLAAVPVAGLGVWVF